MFVIHYIQLKVDYLVILRHSDLQYIGYKLQHKRKQPGALQTFGLTTTILLMVIKFKLKTSVKQVGYFSANRRL